MRYWSLLLLFTCLHPSVAIIVPYDQQLARMALEFAAAAYSPEPAGCTSKNNATFILRVTKRCDYLGDECWGVVSLTDDWIVISFRGTRTKLQLIMELVETMSEPKKKLGSGGSVQHYFYVALQAIWQPLHDKIRKLKTTYPDRGILFTGHSLGGALASLASTIFSFRHPTIRNKINLITFGQPRVGNFQFAQSHDQLVIRSWRVIHRYDLVAHLPFCASLPRRSCSPFFNHAPYHHGTEVWYRDHMNETDGYKVCLGAPLDEDDSCSNGWYLHYGIKDHLFYFEHHVSDYGVNNCIDPSNSFLT